jgi:hypothetical protein
VGKEKHEFIVICTLLKALTLTLSQREREDS